MYIETSITSGLKRIWTEEAIKKAFNFGNGTMKHFKNYMDNNKKHCIFEKIK